MTSFQTPRDASPRGRPRSAKAQRAILLAASELLLERGLNAISMDAVAERAGVSKATIYRWWSSKELLALDALFIEWQAVGSSPEFDSGSLEDDLLALVGPWAKELAARPYGRVLSALISRAQSDPAFAEEYRARFVEPRREQARRIFARALERGEMAPDSDVEAAVDLLYGPFYHRVLHGHAAVDERFVRAVVGYVVASTPPAPAGEG
jgi:AcrR family transcriptional regulator